MSAMQDLFPGSFTGLVRVYNHHAVDLLLSQHEVAATQRDHAATAVAQARKQLEAVQAKGGSKGTAAAASAGGGCRGDPEGRAAARLAKAEAELASRQERVEGLESETEAARQAALKKPLGTAFIALFRWGGRLRRRRWVGWQWRE